MISQNALDEVRFSEKCRYDMIINRILPGAVSVLANPFFGAGLMFRSALFVVLFLGLNSWGAEPLPPLPRVAPLSPEKALKSFKAREGFEMQLLAAEPLVTDPVAGAYDEQGRLFVVEMNDYPYTDKSTDKPSVERTTDLPLGKVRVLYDDNDDGVFDRSEIFARDLSWPTGIAIYKHGVFVAGTPDCWYLKDTDADGVADVRTKVFSGFKKLNVQAVVNNLIWGLDNHLYGAGGTNGGTIQQPLLDKKPIALVRGDFRFDPRRPEFEILSGGSRFGNTFDDFGNRFICNIRNPIQQVVLPSRYIARNPSLAVVSLVHDVSVIGDQVPVYRASPPEPWRVINAARLTAQGDPLIPRSEKNAQGFMTSACGTTVYRGDAYPREFKGGFFVGEVAANLIHREVAQWDGITFRSKRGEENAEFLTSTDNWFRPVNFVHAPDGTLHVLDMYRETIEHPWSIPDDLKQLLDLESGRDKGRIYRLAPPKLVRRPTTKLGDLSSEQLVSYLDHANVWHRETAQRLLFERQDKRVIPVLQEMLKSAKSPEGRLHTLAALDGLQGVRPEDLMGSLADGDEHVRAHALRLSEGLLKDSSQTALRDKVLGLQDDPSLAVRFQLAFTLGEFQDPRCARGLLTLSRKDAGNAWMAIAILSSATLSGPTMLEELGRDREFLKKESSAPLLVQLASVVGNRNKDVEIVPLAGMLGESPDLAGTKAIVLGLQEGVKRQGRTLLQVWKTTPESAAAGGKLLEHLLAEAKKEVVDSKLELAKRLEGVKVLACGTYPTSAGVLLELLSPKQPRELQSAAVKTLTAYADPGIAEELLKSWSNYSPPTQFEVAEALALHPQRLGVLFDAIEKKQVSASQLSPLRRTLLMKHFDPKLKERAIRLFGAEQASPRSQVIAAYQSALSKPGRAANGQQIFQAQCLSCHRMGDQGYDVGPSLVTVRHRRADEILTQILDPNREVGPNFAQYVVVLSDGRVLTGMIAEETPNSITLKRQEGKQEVILRGEIEELKNTGLSLMPEGLEKTISPEQMADLLAYLRGS